MGETLVSWFLTSSNQRLSQFLQCMVGFILYQRMNCCHCAMNQCHILHLSCLLMQVIDWHSKGHSSQNLDVMCCSEHHQEPYEDNHTDMHRVVLFGHTIPRFHQDSGRHGTANIPRNWGFSSHHHLCRTSCYIHINPKYTYNKISPLNKLEYRSGRSCVQKL